MTEKMRHEIREYLDLFNTGKHHESHDVLEVVWLKLAKDDKYRDLYKGLIQVAAAIHQIRRSVHDGGMRLLKSSSEYLMRYENDSLGVDVKSLCREIEMAMKNIDHATQIKVHTLPQTGT